MVIRSAVGALCVVAVLGAVAMALPERTRSKASAEKKDPPFGALTKTAFVDPTRDEDLQTTSTAAEAAKLLKLKKFPEAQSRPKDPSSGQQLIQPPPPSASVPAPVTAPGALAAALKRPTASDAETTEAPVLAMADPEPPVRDVPSPAAPAPSSPRTKEKSSDSVDINRASEDILDHLPGGGRIGRSIVRHRPYRTIEDLVRKRVLRMSAFQRIQASIKVD